MLPRAMVAGTIARPRPILFRSGTQQSQGWSAAEGGTVDWLDCRCLPPRKTVSSLAFLLFGKGHTLPRSRLCPHWGAFYPNAFCNLCLIRITYPGRLLARDLLFHSVIVRRGTPVETGMAGYFSGYPHTKEAGCSAWKYAIRLTL
jgi:hypothetical protein